MDPERDTEPPTQPTPPSAPLETGDAAPDDGPELTIERASLAASPLPAADEDESASVPGPAEPDAEGAGRAAQHGQRAEEAHPPAAGGPQESDDPAEPDDASAALSPAVRRLVRQYDLDVTGIHGTGPAGKIRVGDVIALIGARPDDSLRDAARNGPTSTANEERSAVTHYRSPLPTSLPAEAGAVPATTVFECDVSRVLGHRKRLRRDNVDVLLTSYFAVACAEALKAVPEIAAHDTERPARLGILLSAADGEERATLLDAADESPLASIADRLRSVDAELRANGEDDGPADLLIHHYGASGSVLATPLPLGNGHVAAIGFGRVRRQIVVKEGEESPRVAAVCYVTLTFTPHRLALRRANRFLAQLVRVLEQWPD